MSAAGEPVVEVVAVDAPAQLLSWSRGSDDSAPALVAKVIVVRGVVRDIALETPVSLLSKCVDAATRSGTIDRARFAGLIVACADGAAWQAALRPHADPYSLQIWIEQAAFAAWRAGRVVDAADIPLAAPPGELVIDSDVGVLPAWIVGLATDVARRDGGMRIMLAPVDEGGSTRGMWWASSRTIKLAADLADEQRVRVLAHEIGHAVDPELGRSTTESERWADRFAIVVLEAKPRTVAAALASMAPPVDAVASLRPITGPIESRDQWLWRIAFNKYNLLSGEETNG